MLSVDQEKGIKGKPGVLLELAQYRRLGGKMHFGVLLAAASCDAAQGHAAARGGGQADCEEMQEHKQRGGQEERVPAACSAVDPGDGMGAGGGGTDSNSWMEAEYGCLMRVGDPAVARMQSGEAC